MSVLYISNPQFCGGQALSDFIPAMINIIKEIDFVQNFIIQINILFHMSPLFDSQYFDEKLSNFIRTIIFDWFGILYEHLQVELHCFQDPSKYRSNNQLSFVFYSENIIAKK